MSDDEEQWLARAKKLMLLAAEYIDKDPYVVTLHYDGAECDGMCLSDDLKNHADELMVEAEER